MAFKPLLWSGSIFLSLGLILLIGPKMVFFIGLSGVIVHGVYVLMQIWPFDPRANGGDGQ